jgi:hypothetical protein
MSSSERWKECNNKSANVLVMPAIGIAVRLALARRQSWARRGRSKEGALIEEAEPEVIQACVGVLSVAKYVE